jgi:hypothetical protein
VSLVFCNQRDRGICILFGGSLYQTVSIFDSEVRKREISLVSQSGSELGWGGAVECFGFDSFDFGAKDASIEMMGLGMVFKVTARILRDEVGNSQLEVEAEEIPLHA